MLVRVSDAAFQALAEPRRRAMLRLVHEKPRSVNEIAQHFDITQQAVSQLLETRHRAADFQILSHAVADHIGRHRLYAPVAVGAAQ